MLKCCPQHLHMGTTGMKRLIETEKEGKHKMNQYGKQQNKEKGSSHQIK